MTTIMKLTLKNTLIIFYLLFSLNILANNLNGIKICINPGHGGLDPQNDRNIVATGFWESEGNLIKGLYLDTLLRELGATTTITRVLNRDEDDLSFSAIAQITNDFEADVFLSIHSNASSSGQVNYALTLFRGTDDAPVITESKTFAVEMWPQIFNKGFIWTHTFQNARGDFSFYGNTSGLAVLRNLTVPAALSEGSFHDYIPESWRLKSEKYCRSESHAFVRAILTHFNKPGLTKGSIAGLIKDKYRNVSYYSVPNSNDLFLPVNNAKVTLLPNNIVQYTDALNNGFVFFEDLNPGNYQIIIEANNYFTDTIDATVVANESTKFENFLEPSSATNVTVNLINPTNLSNKLSIFEKFTFEFQFQMDTTKVNNSISINPASNLNFEWINNKTIIISPETYYQPNSATKITIDTTAETIFGTCLQENQNYSFNTDSLYYLTITKISADTINISDFVSFKLSHKTTTDEIANHLTISPNVEYKLIWSNINKKLYVKPESNFPPNNYTISFKSGLKCVDAIHETKIDFTFVVKANSTEINRTNSNNNIKISPNPTTNNLTISNLNSNAQIKLYDLTGNLVFSKLNITENKTNINISTLSKGIYILKIKFKDRELIKKIMKQ